MVLVGMRGLLVPRKGIVYHWGNNLRFFGGGPELGGQ